MGFLQKWALSCSLLMLTVAPASAQLIARSTISALGPTLGRSGVHVQSSVGQPSMIGVERGDHIIVRHGFIQPMSFGRISFKPPAFSVYPNPSQHVFGVYGTLIQGDDVRIFDAQGRLVWAIRVDAQFSASDPSADASVDPSSAQQFQIDLSDHAPGMYHLHIQRNNQPLSHINLVLSP